MGQGLFESSESWEGVCLEFAERGRGLTCGFNTQNMAYAISLVPHQEPRLIPGVLFRVVIVVERPLAAEGAIAPTSAARGLY